MDQEASLERTPTWAFAFVCFVLILTSILIEYAFHLLTDFLKKRKKKSLIQALYQIKLELMVLGFISLLLTVAQQPISKICIPKRLGNSFLPCSNGTLPSDVEEDEKCQKKGMISLISSEGSNQLQLLIFSLALFHVISCLLTMFLGMAQFAIYFSLMNKWVSWEEETRSLEYKYSNDPRRFRLSHQTPFGRRHLRFWSDSGLLLWPVCFFRQLIECVSKADYLALRHGFIMAHFPQESNFDFQRFIRRALDDDFVEVVRTRLWIWMFSMLFIIFSAHGFQSYIWLPAVPSLILLVGTKLEVIITQMCLASRKWAVVPGEMLVKPNNDHFWFGRPRLLLHLIHFILFQNSFQLALFTWSWYKFGWRSCFHGQTKDFAVRIAIGILVQILCGYVTLPLYALVTQMGSSLKASVFTERVAMGLKKWHKLASKNVIAVSKSGSTTPSARPSFSNTITTGPSTLRPSPTHTVVASTSSDLHETAGLPEQIERSSGEIESVKSDEIGEEETGVPNTNRFRGTYHGEISFRW